MYGLKKNTFFLKESFLIYLFSSTKFLFFLSFSVSIIQSTCLIRHLGGWFAFLLKLGIGPIALNFDDLLNKLKEHLKHPEKTNKKFKKFREKFREKIFKEEDCFKQIIKILN